MPTMSRRLWLNLLCLGALLAVLLYCAGAASGVLTVHFINVGQGDCCWLHLPNDDDVLVDGGKPQGPGRNQRGCLGSGDRA